VRDLNRHLDDAFDTVQIAGMSVERTQQIDRHCARDSTTFLSAQPKAELADPRSV